MHTAGPFDGKDATVRGCVLICMVSVHLLLLQTCIHTSLASQPSFFSLLSCTPGTERCPQHSVVTLWSVMTTAHAHFVTVTALCRLWPGLALC
jgi:hypothetical protein